MLTFDGPGAVRPVRGQPLWRGCGDGLHVIDEVVDREGVADDLVDDYYGDDPLRKPT
jgi:hypothetical protein